MTNQALSNDCHRAKRTSLLAIILLLGTIAVAPEKIPCQAVLCKDTTAGAPASSAGVPDQLKEELDRLFKPALEFLREGKDAEACELLQKAARLKPDSAGIHCNLGLAYENTGNLDAALKEFKRALELSPSMPEAAENLAGCYQSLGQTAQAIDCYRRYISEHPEARDRGQIKDIIASLEAASTKDGADPRLPDYFASITAEGRLRWKQEKMPIKVFIQDGTGVPGYRPSFFHLFKEALDAWVEATGNRLSYVTVSERRQADVVCNFAAEPQGAGSGLSRSERGQTALRASDGTIYGGTLQILTSPLLEDGILSDTTMKKACLHETGHLFGLNGHSTNISDIMFVTIDSPAVRPALSDRDRATIMRLYEDWQPEAPQPIPQGETQWRK